MTKTIGFGGCLRGVLDDYLNSRKQYVASDGIVSKALDVTSWVPQGFLLGQLLFCILINVLSEVLNFSSPYICADDLKILTDGGSEFEVQEDIRAIDKYVFQNKIDFAIDKCAELLFRKWLSPLRRWAPFDPNPNKSLRKRHQQQFDLVTRHKFESQ